MATKNGSPVVLFDGVCNLCNGWVNFVIDHAPEDTRIRFGALQSDEGRALMREMNLDQESMESVILIENGKVWRESTAVLNILSRLKPPWSWLSMLRIFPRALRDVVYGWIARNRYGWFGRRDSCRIPTPELQRWFLKPESAAPRPQDAAEVTG